MAKLTAQSANESSVSTQEDNILDDLRAKYEQAILKHSGAKARLTQLPTKDAQGPEISNHIGKIPGVAASRQRHFESHLENLRLQKRYKNLRILSQYAEQANQIASDEGIFDAQKPNIPPIADKNDSDQQVALAATQQHLDALHEDVKASTIDLEIALVKARQQLKVEQNLLEKARSRSKASQNGAATNELGLARQRAMEATRDELQNWIARSLARCEQAISPAKTSALVANIDDSKQPEEDIDAAIDSEYEQYLEVRLRLVQIALTLRAPLHDAENEGPMNSTSNPPVETKPISEERQKFPIQRAPHLRHKSRISVHKLAEQMGGPSLTKIESSCLPDYHHEKFLNTHLTYLQGQIAAQDARLLQGLGLLSHESHLLPSYPLPSTDHTNRHKLQDLSQQQLDAEHLLAGWGFASDTAEEVLKEGVLGNIDETKEVLERARQHLKEIQILEDMKRQVVMG